MALFRCGESPVQSFSELFMAGGSYGSGKVYAYNTGSGTTQVVPDNLPTDVGFATISNTTLTFTVAGKYRYVSVYSGALQDDTVIDANIGDTLTLPNYNGSIGKFATTIYRIG